MLLHWKRSFLTAGLLDLTLAPGHLPLWCYPGREEAYQPGLLITKARLMVCCPPQACRVRWTVQQGGHILLQAQALA